MSCTRQCKKYIRSALQIFSLPGQPPTGHEMLCAPYGNNIRYVLASSGGCGGGGPSAPPGPTHAGLVSGTPVNPPPVTRCSRVSRLSVGEGTGRKCPPLSSKVRRPPPSIPQARDMDGIDIVTKVCK